MPQIPVANLDLLTLQQEINDVSCASSASAQRRGQLLIAGMAEVVNLLWKSAALPILDTDQLAKEHASTLRRKFAVSKDKVAFLTLRRSLPALAVYTQLAHTILRSPTSHRPLAQELVRFSHESDGRHTLSRWERRRPDATNPTVQAFVAELDRQFRALRIADSFSTSRPVRHHLAPRRHRGDLVPQMFWVDPAERIRAQYFAGTAQLPRVRAFCSLLLVQLLEPNLNEDEAAANFLGYEQSSVEDLLRSARVLRKRTRERGHVDDLLEALTAVATEIGVRYPPINYRVRRVVFRNLELAETDVARFATAAKLHHLTKPLCAPRVSAELWSRLTGSEWRYWPLITKHPALSSRTFDNGRKLSTAIEQHPAEIDALGLQLLKTHGLLS